MPKKAKNDKSKIEINLQPTRDIPVTRLYSNHIEVSQSPHDFTLKFCDATPIVDIDEVAKNNYILKIPVVSEIIIPFHVMEPLINVLAEQHEKYKQRFIKSDEDK